jgi:16S rRNA (guanine966-N2)-methyltransferase
MKISKRPLGTVRLIAGKLRSRIVQFNPDLGVRPTTDRLRETMFNWLSHDLIDARCLDLFAGSGAMGFEAASRGASHVLMCDTHPKVIESLKANVRNLKEEAVCQILNYTWSPQSKPLTTTPLTIIFLDPPYEQNLLIPAIFWCYESGAANQNTLICFEAEKSLDLSALNETMDFIKHKHTKHIQYGLLIKRKLNEIK